ncbi:MAG: biotin synthase BioB [Deltaproteobacteria bacterium]|nr:biotin synthase BioB [Deltaproteobacteria bacterium]
MAGTAPSADQARWIVEGDDVSLLPLLDAAFRVREKHFGREVMIHVLNNVQNGLCPEDCGYCSQNKDSEAPIRKYAMKSDEEIFGEAEKAARAGATRYCMVLSGRGPTIERAKKFAKLIRELKSRYPVEVCLSAGLLGDEHAKILAEAGLDRLNHNLNTSEARYDKVCTTHTYADRVETLDAARRHGIGTCSGLIVGMGEGTEDLIEVAFKLRELEVPSIPVNFLIPIEGNRVMHDGSLDPVHCLRVLCLMRFVNPTAEIRLAGGREGNLRSMQPLGLYPANSLFVEGYLTTRGDAARDTYQMIADAGFTVSGNSDYDGPLPETSEFRLPGPLGDLLKPEISAR